MGPATYHAGAGAAVALHWYRRKFAAWGSIMISVSIVNVTSYTGLELLRLLAQHPHFILTSVTARSAVGKRLDEVFPQLTSGPNVGDKEHISLDPGLVITEEPARTDLAFVCLPH